MLNTEMKKKLKDSNLVDEIVETFDADFEKVADWQFFSGDYETLADQYKVEPEIVNGLVKAIIDFSGDYETDQKGADADQTFLQKLFDNLDKKIG